MATPKLCSIDGCGNPAHARGWCGKHLMRWRKYGDPTQLRERRTGDAVACSIDGCSRPVKSAGLCNRHYLRKYRHGSPIGGSKRADDGQPRKWLNDHVAHVGDECLIWPFAKHPKKGEAVIQDRQTRQAARLMCILAHGEPPASDSQAAHECGNGHLGCVNPRHLSWKSPKENTWDKVRHGTMRKGERVPQAKLTEAQVRVIRAAADSASIADLAAAFGVHAWTISDVIDRKTWAWL